LIAPRQYSGEDQHPQAEAGRQRPIGNGALSTDALPALTPRKEAADLEFHKKQKLGHSYNGFS
jgi:hypothetical protein